MKKYNYLIVFGLLAVFALSGCAPPTTATKNKITINATQPAADEWRYSISTAGGSNITKVVFTLTVPGCTVKSMPVGWRSGNVAGGIQVESATGAINFIIVIQCDAVDGPIYIDAHILGGAANTLGPISGPT